MEKKEKENVVEFGGRSYGNEATQEILQRCALLLTDNEALMKENKSLKFQLGGFKTSNANYKKQVEKLKDDVEHFKSLDIEGDEMYNEKLTELDECKKTILSLNSQITELNVRIGELISDNNTLKVNRDDWKELYDFYKMPWYRRIFMRIRE